MGIMRQGDMGSHLVPGKELEKYISYIRP